MRASITIYVLPLYASRMMYIFSSEEVEWRVKDCIEAVFHHKGKWKDPIKDNVKPKKIVVQLLEFASGGSVGPHHHNSKSEHELIYYIIIPNFILLRKL